MKEELDKQLCEQYPKIFRDRYAPMHLTAMCWGISVGDGWFNIIRAACSNIQHHINHTREVRASAIKYNRALARALKGDMRGLEHRYTFEGKLSDWGRARIAEDVKLATYRAVPEVCPQVVAIQIKEKFGGLRFYYDGGDSRIDGVIRMAESMSYVTCEECGSPGKSTNDGWIRVLCETHKAEYEAKRKAMFGEDDELED